MFNNKTRDTFDEVFLACEDHTHSMLTSLNEEMKNGMASSVANAILSRARKIFGANSFATLERTGGRWTRYQPAREIDSCLQYLKSMVSSVHTSQTTDQSDFRRLSSYVQSLQTIRDFLASSESRFAEHFEDEMIKYTFMTLGSTLEHGVNSLILQLVDYIKGDYGKYVISVKRVDLSGDVVINTAQTLAFHITSGKMVQIFATTTGVTESFDFSKLSTAVTGGVDRLKTLARNPVLRGLGYSAGFLVILINIRDILFYLLRSSNKVSQWAEARALFLEMNARNLGGTNPGVAAKQMAVAQKFRNLADSFNLENRASNAEVARSASADNRELSSIMASSSDLL